MGNRRISVDVLGIEVTRKCNLKCKHCCRGEAQNLDIELRYIDKIFDYVGYVKAMVVTGGEPAMNITAVKHINDVIRDKGVYVESISMVTNGTYRFKELCRVTSLLNEVSHGFKTIAVSTDKYHTNEHRVNITSLKRISEGYGLMLFEKNQALMDTNLAAAGRARKINDDKRPYWFCIPVLKHGNYYSLLHLTAKGNVVGYASGEFCDEDNKENIICHVTDLSCVDDLIHAIKKYNDMPKVKNQGVFHYLYDSFIPCMKCPQWKRTYQGKINHMAVIADRNWNISDVDKDQFLKERYWHDVFIKLVTDKKNGDPFALCDWWVTHKRDDSKDIYVVEKAQQIIADRIVEYNKRRKV